jgi:hypothetical protein
MPAAIPPVDDLYTSSMKFARSALEAHAQDEHMLVSLYACSALEQLTKACLANRHPSLLIDLSSDKNWKSLRILAGFPDDKSTRVWTVGIEKALIRVNDLMISKANVDDLLLLIAIRNGVVHMGHNQVVEESLVIAFIQQVDASIKDLAKDRPTFWGVQLEVVDAMLAETSNKIERDVTVKLAQGRATFERKYGHLAEEMQQVLRSFEPSPDSAEETCICPACKSMGIATGRYDLEVDYEADHGESVLAGAWYDFSPRSFTCRTCGLDLDTPAEMEAAGIPPSWESDLDPALDDAEWNSTTDR